MHVFIPNNNIEIEPNLTFDVRSKFSSPSPQQNKQITKSVTRAPIVQTLSSSPITITKVITTTPKTPITNPEYFPRLEMRQRYTPSSTIESTSGTTSHDTTPRQRSSLLLENKRPSNHGGSSSFTHLISTLHKSSNNTSISNNGEEGEQENVTKGSLVVGKDFHSTSIPMMTTALTTNTNTDYDELLALTSTKETNRRKVIVFGFDLTLCSPKTQFVCIATGFFSFSLLYGYLQELISVQLANRELALFLASLQFSGYSLGSFIMLQYDRRQRYFQVQKNGIVDNNKSGHTHSWMKNKTSSLGRNEISSSLPSSSSISDSSHYENNNVIMRNEDDVEKNLQDYSMNQTYNPSLPTNSQSSLIFHHQHAKMPLRIYLILSVLRAIDLCMTNLAMAYLNYPAKTLMKSSRVVFTMLFASIFWRKQYRLYDYFMVLLMVLGLGLFLHADSTASVVFDPMGIIMITISLLCDGAVINISERVMNLYDIGQDEFIFRLYSIAFLAITVAAAFEGDLTRGVRFLSTSGTWEEVETQYNLGRTHNNYSSNNRDLLASALKPPLDSSQMWHVHSKIFVIVLFSAAGFFSSSCSSAITKEFGALTMSITSTARKATTLFLSFALFGNVCTIEHIVGIVFFVGALTAKSIRASKRMNHDYGVGSMRGDTGRIPPNRRGNDHSWTRGSRMRQQNGPSISTV